MKHNSNRSSKNSAPRSGTKAASPKKTARRRPPPKKGESPVEKPDAAGKLSPDQAKAVVAGGTVTVKDRTVVVLPPCPDCGVAAGEKHEDGCFVETCPYCGGQRLTCVACIGHRRPRRARLPWTGEPPGMAECREFGWYAKHNPNGVGLVSCQPEEPGAMEDLNRLRVDAIWDPDKKRWVKK